jgi:hypothetical protein
LEEVLKTDQKPFSASTLEDLLDIAREAYKAWL